MQLIGMLDSPYVRRVAATLLTGGVAFQHRPISLFRHIDEFSKISPLLKAPTLVADDGTVLVESNIILEYLATLSPSVAALMPRTPPTFRATGLALTICEKAVQVHYERELRAPSERSQSWIDRITKQLTAGLDAQDREAPEAGWIDGGALGLADITVACAFGFTQGPLANLVDLAHYPRLAAFCARAESLSAFRAAPPVDGVTAPAH
jgi:glutathione S-transferase